MKDVGDILHAVTIQHTYVRTYTLLRSALERTGKDGLRERE